jgi:hypothetical protein
VREKQVGHATLNPSARRITSELNGLRVAVMPFARVGQRDLSRGKSHAGTLSPFCSAGGASAMLAAHSRVIRTGKNMNTKNRTKEFVAQIRNMTNNDFIEFSMLLFACRLFWEKRKRYDSSEMKIFLVCLSLSENIYRDLRSGSKILGMKRKIDSEYVQTLANLCRPLFEASIWLNWILHSGNKEKAEFRKNLYILYGLHSMIIPAKRPLSYDTDIGRRIAGAIIDNANENIATVTEEIKQSKYYQGLTRELKDILRRKQAVPPSLLPMKILKKHHNQSQKYADYEHLSFYAHVLSSALPNSPQDLFAEISKWSSIGKILGIAKRSIASSLAVIVHPSALAQLVQTKTAGTILQKNIDLVSFD